MPTDERLEVSARAEALERELQGDLRGAVVVLGGMLVHQRRLEASEVGEIERGPEPSPEELRTVLGSWIQRGAAWGGPILGWMRDLHDRLEAPGGRKRRGRAAVKTLGIKVIDRALRRGVRHREPNR